MATNQGEGNMNLLSNKYKSDSDNGSSSDHVLFFIIDDLSFNLLAKSNYTLTRSISSSSNSSMVYSQIFLSKSLLL